MLEILYQDEYIIAINKPSGLLVHKSFYARDAKVLEPFTELTKKSIQHYISDLITERLN